MADDIAAKGLRGLWRPLAVDSEWPGRTNRYPEIPDHLDIEYYIGGPALSQKDSFLEAQKFLKQEHILFTAPASDDEGTLRIEGKEGVKKLLETLHDFSTGARTVAELGPSEGTAKGHSSTFIWHALKPWLEEALKIDPPGGGDALRFRGSRPMYGSAIRVKAEGLMRELGSERAAEIAENIGKLAAERGVGIWGDSLLAAQPGPAR